MKKKNLIVLLILGFSALAPVAWYFSPVQAEVFRTQIPNVDLGILDFKIIGEYDLSLEDLNMTGFFRFDGEPVVYSLEIESAEVYYEAGVNGTRLEYLRYQIKYKGFNFSVSSPSRSFTVDYVQLSARGILKIELTSESSVEIAVFEMVPRMYLQTGSHLWPEVEIIMKGGESQT